MSPAHRYRKLLSLFDWHELTKPLRNLYSSEGRKGYAIEQGFRCLFLQHYSTDPDARYGAKSKRDIWLGYKRHVGVDMHQGLIAKVAITPANVHDGKAFEHVRPSQGAVIADKMYSDGVAAKEMKRRGLHSMVMKKNNAKGKDKRKDAFFSMLRMPYEGVFSKMSRRARYRGQLKVYFQAIMEAMVHNVKRLCIIRQEPVPLV